MSRVTYGTTLASYHSIRSLREKAKHTNNDVTKFTITRDFYVEDLLSGANSLEDVCHLQDSLIAVLHEIGFPLLKWTSNEPQLISRLSENLRESGESILLKDIFWLVITCKSPVIIRLKHFLQPSWVNGTGCDDSLPDSIVKEWSEWRKHFKLQYS